MISLISKLLQTSRLYYVPLAVVPPVAGYLNGSNGTASVLTAIAIGLTFCLLAMAAWSANDFFDRESDGRGETKRIFGIYVSGGTNSNVVDSVSGFLMWSYILLLASISLAISAIIGGTFLLLSVSSCLVGLCYSMPPVRLKARGAAGAVITTFTYGLVGYVAGFSVSESSIQASTLIFGSVMSILILGFEGIAHLVDYSDDSKNCQVTVAVQLGRRRTKLLLALCQLFPILFILLLRELGFMNIGGSALLTMIPIVLCSATILVTAKSERTIWAVRAFSTPVVSVGFLLFLHH